MSDPKLYAKSFGSVLLVSCLTDCKVRDWWNIILFYFYASKLWDSQCEESALRWA